MAPLVNKKGINPLVPPGYEFMVLHTCSSSIASIAITDLELGACTGLELNVKNDKCCATQAGKGF